MPANTPLMSLLDPRFMEEQVAWKDDAACKYEDANLFDTENLRIPLGTRRKPHAYRTARHICESCKVHDECLEYALDQREPTGIWGGKTMRERRAIIKERGEKWSQ